MNAGGGDTSAARDATHDPSRAGWIPCCICTDPIPLDEYRTARCWTDPNGITCAAHARCLLGVGERDLGLR